MPSQEAKKAFFQINFLSSVTVAIVVWSNHFLLMDARTQKHLPITVYYKQVLHYISHEVQAHCWVQLHLVASTTLEGRELQGSYYNCYSVEVLCSACNWKFAKTRGNKFLPTMPFLLVGRLVLKYSKTTPGMVLLHRRNCQGISKQYIRIQTIYILESWMH